MKFKTTVSKRTLAKYAELVWNYDGDSHVPWGDVFLDSVGVGDDDASIVDKRFLMDELEWIIEGSNNMLEEDELCNGEKMPKQRVELRDFRKAVKKFEKSVEEVAEWEFDTDEELVSFEGNKAIAKE